MIKNQCCFVESGKIFAVIESGLTSEKTENAVKGDAEFAAKLAPRDDKGPNLSPCCIKTMDTLSHINNMMVCSDCKRFIKTFKDERAYTNYVKFCQSRSRNLSTWIYKDQWVVSYY